MRARNDWIVVAGLLLACGSGETGSDSQPPASVLEPRPAPQLEEAPQQPPAPQVLDRQVFDRQLPAIDSEWTEKLEGGETLRFGVALNMGDVFHAVVEQRQVDVALVFSDGEGGVLAHVDSPNGSAGLEELVVVAESAGEYWFEIDAGRAFTAGEVLLRVVSKGPATSDDHKRSSAWRRYSEGEQLREEGRLAEALAEYEAAERLWHGLEDPLSEARALRRQGQVEIGRGRPERARQLLERARPAFDDEDNGWELAAFYNDLGEARRWAGEPHRAFEQFGQALAAARRVGNDPGTATALSNQGLVFDLLGETEEALGVYRESLAIWQRLSRPDSIATTQHNLGMAYAGLGRLDDARQLLDQALATHEDQKSLWGQAVVWSGLGWVHTLGGDTAAALDAYRRARDLHHELGDLRGEVVVLGELAELRRRRGDLAQALALQQEGLDRVLETGSRLGEALARGRLAAILREQGKVARAEEELTLARREFQRLAAARGEAGVLMAFGRAAHLAGDLGDARRHFEEGLSLVESSRGRLQGLVVRRSYLESRFEDYDLYLDLLLTLGEADPDTAAESFRAAERVRARSLADELNLDPGWRTRADPELVDQERALRERIAAKEDLRLRLEQLAAGGDRSKNLSAEIDALLRQHQELDGRLRRSAGLGPPGSQLADLETARATLVDEETTVLAYHLGARGSHVWVLSRRGSRVARLPPVADLESLLGRLLRGLAQGDAVGVREQTADDAALLAEVLLAPVADLLAGERLVVVTGGPSALVPFAVLPMPGTGPDGPPLLERFEVIQAPSASVLVELGRRPAGRASRALAVVAAPLLGQVAQEGDSPTTRAGLDPGTWSPLPYAQAEAEAVLALIEDPTERLALLGSAATVDAVRTAPLDQYRTLHFATHGILDDRAGGISGLVLSVPEGSAAPLGQILRLHEIERLALRADLVVLSACSTALGERVRGEGVVGMAQAFFRAGARSLVVSHWKVDDEATAELMRRFHRHRIVDGLPPATALRRAQLGLRDETRWSSPAYWGAFSFQGDGAVAVPSPH